MATLSRIIVGSQNGACATYVPRGSVRAGRAGRTGGAYATGLGGGGVCQEKFGRVEIYIRLFCKNLKIRTIDKYAKTKSNNNRQHP